VDLLYEAGIMKLGANEPKKVAALGVLVLVAGYLAYTNIFSGPSVPTVRTRPAPTAAENQSPLVAPAEPGPPLPPRATAPRGRSDEFHPVLHSKRPEDRIDTSKIDPTLRLDLLAKLQSVELPTGGRNPFKMGQPPPPPEAKRLPGPEPIVKPGPMQTVAVPPAPPAGPPPPPPITLKYYGFTSGPASPAKTAFFLDGEDILVAKEGDTLKRRYKVVRIGANSVVMEDTDSKRQQTIPLTEEAG
jgi:hypothetical protein